MKMVEIRNSDNSGGVIIPEDLHDQVKEWQKQGERERELWKQAIAEGNAYIIDEDGNETKV